MSITMWIVIFNSSKVFLKVISSFVNLQYFIIAETHIISHETSIIFEQLNRFWGAWSWSKISQLIKTEGCRQIAAVSFKSSKRLNMRGIFIALLIFFASSSEAKPNIPCPNCFTDNYASPTSTCTCFAPLYRTMLTVFCGPGCSYLGVCCLLKGQDPNWWNFCKAVIKVLLTKTIKLESFSNSFIFSEK